MTFQHNGPITQERAEAATEWLVHSTLRIAESKAERQRCENMLRVVKSLAMKASGEKSAAAQEREAYASEQYREAIDALFEATKACEVLLLTRDNASTVIDVWRSINTNLRAARV